MFGIRRVASPTQRAFESAVLCMALWISGCTWDASRGFTGLPGPAAKARLGKSWPATVDPDAVVSLDYRSESSIDSSSTWYRIRLGQADAAAWIDDAHFHEEDWTRNLADTHFPEGVRRKISGPPALRRQTGETPEWWSPPALAFTATEIMIWYTDGDSGVARATYSAFDKSNSTLWIYCYTCQHDRLWQRGQLPNGEVIKFEGVADSADRSVDS